MNFITIVNPVNRVQKIEICTDNGYFNLTKVARDVGHEPQIIDKWISSKEGINAMIDCSLTNNIETKDLFYVRAEFEDSDGMYAYSSLYDYFMIWVDVSYILRLTEYLNKLEAKNSKLVKENQRLRTEHTIMYKHVFEISNKSKKTLGKIQKMRLKIKDMKVTIKNMQIDAKVSIRNMKDDAKVGIISKLM